ncbi:MAG: GTP cyclohydrolase I FolE [Candidatus Sericytochromatia bacterium]
MSLNPQKVDPELGQRVLKYLTEKGVHTPQVENGLSEGEKIAQIKTAFTTIMQTLGLDLNDDSLSESPDRVAKMYVKEMYWGLDPNYFPKITTVSNKMGYDEMVVEKNIQVQSNCEHHFVIIDGYAHIAYIPRQKVLGLSKLNRVTEYFARRPQIQERLTEQIYWTLEHILETPDIAVMINAKHYCVKARGIEDVNSETVTSKLGGCFRSDPSTRQEFLQHVRSPYSTSQHW